MEGRAKRHTTEADATNPGKAILLASIAAVESGISTTDFVVHGVYKAKNPPPNSGYIYLTKEDRVRWYAKARVRMCKSCGLVEMTKCMRLCDACKLVAATQAATKVKKCKDCGTEIKTRRHRCDACADLRTQAKKEAREAKAAQARLDACTPPAVEEEKVTYLVV